jgi:hypothetical protein
MPIQSVLGLPGVGPTYTAAPKTILQNLQGTEYIDGGRVINGSNSGDWSNPTYPQVLTSGLLMGRGTSDGKYAPSLLGLTQSALASNGTSIAVSSPQAMEIARRLGTSGTNTLAIVGPPTTGGTVASAQLTFSNVVVGSGTNNGSITVASTGTAFAAGSVIVAQDGTQTPICVLDSMYGTPVSDPVTQTRIDAQAPRLLVAGHVIASAVPGLTSCDASVRTYLEGQLNSSGRHFIFDDEY